MNGTTPSPFPWKNHGPPQSYTLFPHIVPLPSLLSLSPKLIFKIPLYFAQFRLKVYPTICSHIVNTCLWAPIKWSIVMAWQ